MPILLGSLFAKHIHTANREADSMDPDADWAPDYALTWADIKRYVTKPLSSPMNSPMKCLFRGLCVALFMLMPCLPLILLINHLEVGLAKHNTVNRMKKCQNEND